MEKFSKLVKEAIQKAKGNTELQFDIHKLLAALQVKMDQAKIELQYVNIGSDEYFQLVDSVNRFADLTYLKINSKVSEWATRKL